MRPLDRPTGLALALALALAGAASDAADAAPALRVGLDEPGVYALDAKDLAKAGLPADGVVVVGSDGLIACDPSSGGISFFAEPDPERRAERSYVVVREAREGETSPRGVRAFPEPRLIFEAPRVYQPFRTERMGELRPYGDPGYLDYHLLLDLGEARELDLPLPDRLEAVGSPELRVTLIAGRSPRGGADVGVRWGGATLGSTRVPGGVAHVATFPVDAKLLRGRKATLAFSLSGGRAFVDRVELHGVRPKGAERPSAPASVEVVDPVPLDERGADYVVIAVDAVREALEPLVAHRRAEGLSVRVLRPLDIYSRFSAGNPGPDGLRRFFRHAMNAWTPKPRYALLVGEAHRDLGGTSQDGEELLPTALVDTFDNGASASDDDLVAFGEDRAQPALALGRVPSSDPKQVARWVERTLGYETRADHGPWRRRLSMIAGEGRFGEAVDRAIEDLATRIFCEAVPYDYDVNMTYASVSSPYLWIPSKLGDKVVERMNEGALLVSYTGHGHMDGFDELRFGRKRYRIFAREDLRRVRASERAPLVFITACWTGCFDDPETEAIGEALLELDAGPPAVFAASRISHPFANALLSKELVSALFAWRGERAPRLGDVLVEAKRRLVEGDDPHRSMIFSYGLMFLQDPALLQRLLKDDMHLYALLGDPALKIAYPGGARVEVTAGPAVAGRPLTVKAKVDGLARGTALISFELARDRFTGEAEDPELDRPGAERRVKTNYEMANRKALWSSEVPFEGGVVLATLKVPDDLLPGTYYVKVYAYGEGASAAASLPLELTYPEEEE